MRPHTRSNVQRIKASRSTINVSNSHNRRAATAVVTQSCLLVHFASADVVAPGFVDRIHKGLSPLATRTWPCDASDSLKFGAPVPTPVGLPEDNNGQVLFDRAGFQPLLVTHIPKDSFAVSASGRAAPQMEMDRDNLDASLP